MYYFLSKTQFKGHIGTTVGFLFFCEDAWNTSMHKTVVLSTLPVGREWIKVNLALSIFVEKINQWDSFWSRVSVNIIHKLNADRLIIYVLVSPGKGYISGVDNETATKCFRWRLRHIGHNKMRFKGMLFGNNLKSNANKNVWLETISCDSKRHFEKLSK